MNKKFIRKVNFRIFLLFSLVIISSICIVQQPQARAAETTYFIYDSPGRSVTSVTNQTQDVINKYEYSDFGKVISSIESVSNTYKYIGEQCESETDLIFLRARYYDSSTGRFITRDPIPGVEKNPQSLNPYIYVVNNPINLTDPYGLASPWWLQAIGIGSTIGGILTGDPFLIWAGRAIGAYGFASTSWDYLHGEASVHDVIRSGIGARLRGWPGVAYSTLELYGTLYGGRGGGGLDFGGYRDPFGDYGWQTLSSYQRNSLRNERSVSMRNDYESWRNNYYGGGPGGGGGGGYGSSYSNLSSYGSLRSSLANYGGVSLSKTAELMLNINDVAGATYDDKTGQIILFGKEDLTLPEMDMDDLSVAVNSVYSSQDPGVSIGTEASPYPGWMKVRYDGDTIDTAFGKVMFDADRLLKCLDMGFDNVTHQSVSSSVSGYQNMITRELYGDFTTGTYSERKWFKPKDMKLTKNTTGDAMVFSEVSMELLTETTFGGGTTYNPESEAFASHFTQHYDEFANEFPVLKELKRLGKITSVVKWIRDNNIPLDMSFLNDYQIEYVPCERYTPEITVTGTRSWTEGNHQYSRTVTLKGGVSYRPPNEYLPDDPIDPLTEGLKDAAIAQRPSEETFAWNFQGPQGSGQAAATLDTTDNFKAVSQSVAKSRKDGNFETQRVDMSLPVSGEFNLELIRYYNSFNEKKTGFGYGWSADAYEMRFPQDKLLFSFGTSGYERWCYHKINIIDRLNNQEDEWTLIGLNMNNEPLYLRDGFVDILRENEDGTFTLKKTDKSTIDFASNGRVIALKDRNNNTLNFNYSSGRLSSISHASGRAITLTYNIDGRIRRADGPGGLAVTYTYDASGNLIQANDIALRPENYTYNVDHQIAAIKDKRSNPAQQNTYDIYNRAAEKVIGGDASFISDFSLKDRMTITTGPGGIQLEERFDSEFRPVEQKDALKNLTQIEYDGDYGPKAIKDGRGLITQYQHDIHGNVTEVKNDKGETIKLYYDYKDNLIARTDPEGSSQGYMYDDNNNLITIFSDILTVFDDEGNLINFYYDPDNISIINYNALGNPISTTDAEGNTQNISYDANGMITGIEKPAGLQITQVYDSLSRLTEIKNKASHNVSLGYDNANNLNSVTTSAGAINYEYDANDNLKKIIDAKTKATQFGYDARNNLESVLDAKSNNTTYTYDVFNNLTGASLPNATSFRYMYDENNRKVALVSGWSQTPYIPEIASQPADKINYGRVDLGSSSSKTLKIYNIGLGDLKVSNITSTNTSFTTNFTGPMTIPGGEIRDIIVTFTPQAEGPSQATLTINNNDSNEGSLIIELLGSSGMPAIKNLQAAPGTKGIVLTWDAYIDVTGNFDHFNIYRATSNFTNVTGMMPIDSTITNVNATTFTDALLDPGTQYYYAVTAVDVGGIENKEVNAVGPVTYFSNFDKIGVVFAIATTLVSEKNGKAAYNSVNNEYLVVYEVAEAGGANYNIKGQRIAANGIKIGSAFNIGVDSVRNERRPAIAYSPHANVYLVVYERYYGPDYDIVGKIVSASGAPGSMIWILDSTKNEFNPCVAFNSTNNEFFVASEWEYSVSDLDIVGARMSESGSRIGAFSLSEYSVSEKHPDLAYSRVNNQYLLAFEFEDAANDNDIVGWLLNSDGTHVGSSAFYIGGFTVNELAPSLAYNSTDNQYLATFRYDYSGNGTDFDIVGQRLSSSGAKAGSAFFVNFSARSENNPDIIYNSTNNEYFVAFDLDLFGDGTYNIVLGRRVSALGGTIGSFIIIGSYTYSAFNPDMAHNTSANEYLAVMEYDYGDTGTDFDVMGQRLGPENPILNVTPSSLAFTELETTKQIAIRNTGNGNLDWGVYPSHAWMTASPKYGYTKLETDTVNVSVNRQGLAPGTYNVFCDIYSDGGEFRLPVTVLVANTAPYVPANPMPQDGATNQSGATEELRLTLSWTGGDPDPGDSVGYDVYLSKDSALVENKNPSALVSLSQALTTYTTAILDYSSTYYWRIVAKDNKGGSTDGPIWSFTTISSQTPVLIPFLPDPTNNPRPLLDWYDIAGAAKYHIQIDNNSDFSSPVINDANVIESQYTPSANLPEGQIFWRAASINSNNLESLYSNPDSFTLDVTALGQVALIPYVPDPTNIQKPTLSWNSVSGANLYHLQVSTLNDFSTLLVDKLVSNAQWTIESNLPEGAIWWRVSAKDLAGNEGAFSIPDSFTIDITPPEPVSIISADSDFVKITVRWNQFMNAAGDFDHFNIYRENSLITNVSGLVPLDPSIRDSSTTTYIDNTAQPNTAYFYAVTSVDRAGNENKNVASFGPASLNGNSPPYIQPAIPNITIPKNITIIVDLTPYKNDYEEPVTNLIWSISGVNEVLLSASINTTTDELTITPVRDATGSDNVALTLTDSGGLTDTQTVTIIVSDFTPPTVDYFKLYDIDSQSQLYTNSRDVGVIIYESSIGSGIAKWLINESANQPLSPDFVLASRPSAYHIEGAEGSRTVYAWVMDRNNNISVLTGSSVYTIILDLTAPKLNNQARVIDATHVEVVYDEPVSNANLAANYSVNGLEVNSVSKLSDTTYRLEFSTSQAEGQNYTVTISNVTDLAGNTIDPANNQAVFRGYDNNPPEFEGLKSCAPQDKTVILSWNPASDPMTPIKYNIYQSETRAGENFSLPSFVTYETIKKIEGLFNGREYFFVVRAEDDAGNKETNLIELSATPTANINLWSQIGLSGETLQCFALDEAAPSNLYAGTAASGIYKSTNSGANWQQDNAGITNLNIQSLAINPTDNRILYAGSAVGNIYKTTASWSVIRTGTGNPVKDIAVSPADSNIVYAATWGEKLLKTENGGSTWSVIGPPLTDDKINVVLIRKDNPSIIYIGTESDGIYKSADGGINFSAVNTGLGNLSIKAIAIDPEDPDTIYAGTATGIYKTQDGLSNWQRLGESVIQGRVNSIDIDNINSNIIYIGTETSGIFRSTRGGLSWVSINDGLTDISIVAVRIDQKHSSIIWAATRSQGVFRRIIQNRPPQISGASISPLNVYKNSTLQAAATGWSDVDLDAEGYSYEWYNQNGVIPGAAADILNGNNFNKGDEIYCKVRPYDGFDYGAAVETNHVVIQNTLPTISEASISPYAAYKSTPLAASGVNWYDPDLDPVDYAFEWHNQAGIITGVTGNTLSPSYFNKHDHIHCVVTPYDGECYGSPKTTQTIEIQNSLPQINLIRPDGGEAWKGLHNIEWTASDIDTDTVLLNFYYQLAGGEWQLIASGETNDGTYQWNTSALPDGFNNYLVKVIAADGEGERSDTSTNPFTLNNQPPAKPENVSAAISGNYINVTWIRNIDSDLAGYKAYCGSSPGVYDIVRDVPNPDAISYQFLIREVRDAIGSASATSGTGVSSAGAGPDDTSPPSVSTAVLKGEDSYVKDEIIIKVKKTLPGEKVPFESPGGAGKPAPILTTEMPDSIKDLNTRHNISNMEKVFKEFKKAPGPTLGTVKGVVAIDKKTLRIMPDLDTIYLLKLPEGSDIKAVIKEYEKDPNIEYAEPNYKAHALNGLESEFYYIAVTACDNMANESQYSDEASVEYLPPDDTYYRTTGTWGQSYQDMWGLHKINIQNAWSIEKGIVNIVVAVIDTGCDYNHEDLSANIWTNPDEIPGNGKDDDGNGFIDDTRGWDFVGANSDTPIQDNDPADGHGHGTHVAGTIAAVTDNYKGIAGISWGGKIMAIKGLADDGGGPISSLAQAIRYAADNGAKVLNNSWGGFGSSLTIKNAIDYAHSLGCVVVVAAGNEFKDALYSNPSDCENAITVGAFDHNDEMAYFSNWGAKIDVAAPGVDILSLRATGTGIDSRAIGGRYYRMSGTSMACPHVAGLAALILSKNSNLTNEEVRQIIRTSSADLGPAGRDDYAGYGRIDAYQALQIDSISLARLSSPEYNAHVSGTIDIIGTAQGANFSNYIIEYGSGDNPTTWLTDYITLSSGGLSQVVNAVLGTLNTSNLEEGDWAIRLSVSDSGGVVSKEHRTITVDRSPHVGWHKNLPYYNEASSPIYADLDNNGSVEIALCTKSDDTSQGVVHLWNANGSYVSGWSKTVGSPINSSPAIGDIDGDGDKEIIAAAYDPEYLDSPGIRQHIFAWHHNGAAVSGWPKTNDYPSEWSSPVLADLNGDGKLDIIVCGTKGNNARIYAYKGDGTVIPGWPIDANGKFESTPAVGDIDGDGQVEIIAITGGTEAKAYAWRKNGITVSGWPRQLDGYGSQKSSPALGDIDLDGKNEVVIGITDEYGGAGQLGKVYVLDDNGANLLGWPKYIGSEYVESSPCLADLDNNGDIEIVVGSSYDQDGSVHIWRKDGTYLAGWPKDAGNAVSSHPIAVDINGDGRCEIIAGTGPVYCKIHIWDINGNELQGWPKRVDSLVSTAAAIGDTDGDGLLELLLSPWGGKIYQWDLFGSFSERKLAWPMFHKNAEHTGLYLLPNYAPTISGLPDKGLAEDSSLDNAIDLYQYAEDRNNPDSELTFTIVGNTNPNCGVTIDSNRYIDINPTLNWYGSSDVTVRVADPEGLYAEDAFSVTVTVINDPPAISPPVSNPAAVDEDNPITIDLTPYETDVEDTGTALNWAVTGADVCSVSGENSADDILTFTPNPNFYGQDTVTLILTDSGGAQAAQNIILTWNAVNDAPVVGDIPDKTFEEGTSDSSLDLDDYVEDVDNLDNEISWTYSGNTHVNISIDPQTHIVTLSSQYGWSGQETITFAAQDTGGLSDSDTVIVTVTPAILEEVSIDLHVDFNQICFSVMPQGLPSPYKASQLIQDMASQGITIDIAMQWDGSWWISHRVDLPFTDFDLNLDQGIFVNAVSDTYNAGRWTIRGDRIALPKSINLYEGWNLVSIPMTVAFDTAIEALQQINSQGGTADVMMWWDGSWWISSQVDLPFTDQNLVKGKSYFIRCYSNSTWHME